MGIKLAETGEVREQRETLIETKYVGTYLPFAKTSGEAYYDFNNNSWHYRPFGGMWNQVSAREIDCANDSGWVKGNYVGTKTIPTVGKAFWDEGKEAWVYKPKGLARQFLIPEDDFQLVRDEDY